MRWGILCTVDLAHDYWMNVDAVVHEALPGARQDRLRAANAAAGYLTVSPTAETQALLAGHQMLFKRTETGFLIGAALVDGDTIPRQPLGAEVRLRFALRQRDADFTRYTAGLGNGFHLFSTATGMDRFGALFLSRPVAGFNASRAYGAGDLRAANAGGGVIDLFQAQRDTGPSGAPVGADWQRVPADTHDPVRNYAVGDVVLSGNRLFQALVGSPNANLNTATDWAQIAILANAYASAADAVTLSAPVFSIDVAALAANALTLRVTRGGTSIRQLPFASLAPLTSLQADLRGLPDGRYRIDVLDVNLSPIAALGREIYLSPQGTAQNWFGLIEITSVAGPLALFDGAGRLTSPVYRLRFLNRAARSRYVFRQPQPLGAGADVAPDAVDGRILVATAPRPLTRIGTGVRLRADDPATGGINEEVLLPHAGIAGLSKQAGQWFSDLHLSNFPPLT